MDDHWLVDDDVAGHGDDDDVATTNGDHNPLETRYEYRWAMLLQGPICLGMKFYALHSITHR